MIFERETKFYKSFFISFCLILAVALSGVFLGIHIETQNLIFESLRANARTYFETIVATRAWNAGYGGVYVEKKAGVQSNPYIDNPDIETKDGRTFTIRNPAMMTREVSEYIGKDRNFSFRITSKKLVNPDNAPDAFERDALDSFEAGVKERFATEVRDGQAYFRYMGPLFIRKDCLKCHDRQGYRVGDVTPSNVGRVASGTGVRKFVDSLPGLGAGNANNLGQYIPVAIPDTTTYPGADYYEIELVQYTEQMHSDLPPTTLRGYRQANTSDPTVSQPHYLGPAVVAQRDKPVRIKFTNKLPTGTTGDLFLPVDTSVMGAGMGPLDMPGMPGMKENYTQNRATLHLHGGLVPWISDGTPHQWTTPAGEDTQYPKGVSVQYVPDMWFDADGNIVPSGTPDATNTPGDGSLTFYYNNQQSARLMFYHDHSYGITRLNVYAGEAAPYLLQDPMEQDAEPEPG